MVFSYIMFIDIENKKYTPILFHDTFYIDRLAKSQKGFAIPTEGDPYIFKKILYALDLLGYIKGKLV
jgi:hypothetical protein